MVEKLNCLKYGERVKELKVPHYASTRQYVMATCLK